MTYYNNTPTTKKDAKKTETAKRVKLARRVLLALILTLPACGATMGESAMGTTGFMREHNRKLEIIRLSGYAPLRASTHGLTIGGTETEEK